MPYLLSPWPCFWICVLLYWFLWLYVVYVVKFLCNWTYWFMHIWFWHQCLLGSWNDAMFGRVIWESVNVLLLWDRLKSKWLPAPPCALPCYFLYTLSTTSTILLSAWHSQLQCIGLIIRWYCPSLWFVSDHPAFVLLPLGYSLSMIMIPFCSIQVAASYMNLFFFYDCVVFYVHTWLQLLSPIFFHWPFGLLLLLFIVMRASVDIGVDRSFSISILEHTPLLVQILVL